MSERMVIPAFAADDCAELGIEPTLDLKEIKRGYALRLRKTRPDDDPQAYQRLREAYDRLMHVAKHSAVHLQASAQTQEIDDEGHADLVPDAAPIGHEQPSPVSAPVVSADVLTPGPSTSPEPSPTSPLESAPRHEPPEDIAKEYWQPGVGANYRAMERDWPQLRERLDRLPLASQRQASIVFADLVLSRPDIPVELLRTLRQQFGWLEDFRSAQQLGAERAFQLGQLIEALMPRPITDPDELHRFRHVIALSRLVARGAVLRIWVLCYLLRNEIAGSVAAFGEGLLRRIGVDPPRWRQMKRALDVAHWSRELTVVGLVVGFAWLVLPDTRPPDERVIGQTAIVLAWRYLGAQLMLLVVIGLITNVRQRIALPQRSQAHWEALKGPRWWPYAGVAALALSGTLFYAADRWLGAPVWFGTASWVMFVVGVLIAAPASGRDQQSVGTVWLWAAVLIVQHLDGATAFLGFCLIGGWCLLCAHLIDSSVGRAVLRALGAEPTDGESSGRGYGIPFWFLVPLLPMVVVALARVRGIGLVWAALTIALALTCIPQIHIGIQWKLLGSVMLLFGMIWLQGAATRFADQKLGRFLGIGGEDSAAA